MADRPAAGVRPAARPGETSRMPHLLIEPARPGITESDADHADERVIKDSSGRLEPAQADFARSAAALRSLTDAAYMST